MSETIEKLAYDPIWKHIVTSDDEIIADLSPSITEDADKYGPAMARALEMRELLKRASIAITLIAEKEPAIVSEIDALLAEIDAAKGEA